MAQSICQIYLHLIFSTKNRDACLSAELGPRVHAYLAGVLRELECHDVLIGGWVDHVHGLFRVNKMMTGPDIVQQVKQDSSKYVKTLDPRLCNFSWQRGYGLFSVSPTHVAAVKEYIETQEEHHRGTTFQEEYRAFLKKYGVEFDEQYVWD